MLGSHPFGTQITWSELESRFSACKLWEDRYRQLILLARQLPSLSDQERGSQLELYGCENRVWLGMQIQPDGRLHFYADSEGRIVKGLLAVILTRIEGLSADDVLALDITAALASLGIADQLSSSRAQGIEAISARLHELARTALGA